MAKNTLTDLNNHLFAQLERLSDEDLTQDQLEVEIKRSKSINDVAKNIVENAKTTLEGIKFMNYELNSNQQMPEQFKLKEANHE